MPSNYTKDSALRHREGYERAMRELRAIAETGGSDLEAVTSPQRWRSTNVRLPRNFGISPGFGEPTFARKTNTKKAKYAGSHSSRSLRNNLKKTKDKAGLREEDI